MSKVTLGDTTAQPFIIALNALLKISFPAKVSWKIGKVVRAIRKENQLYEEERLKALDKYAEKDKDGKVIIEGSMAKLKEEHKDEFAKELKELQEQEIEIGAIKLSLLGDVKIEPQVFAELMDIVIKEG